MGEPTSDVARPMILEVIGALTGTEADLCYGAVHAIYRDGFVLAVTRSTKSFTRWTATDATNAQENLVVDGLLPEGWCGDVRRGWWCSACGGTGNGKSLVYGTAPCEACCPDLDRPWERRGWTSAPRTILDLVAVASLGVPALLRYEALAREACAALREYGCPQPERVVWRVGKRRERRGQEVPLAWWAREGGAKISMADVLSVDGIWYPAKGPETWQHATRELWVDGLALDAIDRDAVRIVVPPVTGAT